MGDTGVQAGTGTSSIQGDTWLDVIHGQTTYSGDTGIAAGSSSANGDTVVGSGHVLHLNAANQTVSLDDGAAVSYTASSTDLELTNSKGDIVYVDTSNLTPGLTGETDVAVNATASLSIDDGKTTVPATFGQQTLTDSTGRVLYVDTTNLTAAGTVLVGVPGTNSVFDALINARDILTGRGRFPKRTCRPF